MNAPVVLAILWHKWSASWVAEACTVLLPLHVTASRVSLCTTKTCDQDKAYPSVCNPLANLCG